MRLAVPADLDAAAFRGWDPAARVETIGGATMGTGWRVRLATVPGLDLAALTRAIAAMLDGLVAQMSHWEPDSLLGRFNRAPAGTRIVLPPDFATVMVAALDVAARSDGAFDPAIGALVDLWGFGPHPVTAPPDDAAIDRALATGGWRALSPDPGPPSSLVQPGGVRLDLSGIAKGYAVDRLAALLRDHGINHALAEIGGELIGMGMRPDADPWWVDLETPEDAAPPLRVALHGLAVATSGDYVRGRHTIDPRSGRPVPHALAVSVLHPSAMLADAWATVLSVTPPAMFHAVAAREGLAARLLARTDAGMTEMLSEPLTRMIG